MKIWSFVIKEICYRRISFSLGLVSIAVATGCLICSLTLLKAYDLRTQTILEEKQKKTREVMNKLQEDMRKTTLKLGLNVVILPKEQSRSDWYAEGYGAKYMPADYADKLATSGVVGLIRHILPVLQQKIKWPEQKRMVTLVGTKGEMPDLQKSQLAPIVQPVPPGTMVLGYELHQSLKLEVGDKVDFLGKEFVIHKCHEERGTNDDATVWISLDEAQEFLGKKGLINAIIALECICVGRDLTVMRSEIERILADTQVFEIGIDKVLARFEARKHAADTAKAEEAEAIKFRTELRSGRELFASILVCVVIAASGVWIAFLVLDNVRQRSSEIGIMRALGFRSRQIVVLFMAKATLMGILGGILGFTEGFFSGKFLSNLLAQQGGVNVTTLQLFEPLHIILALALAVSLGIIASWIPSMIAAQQNPADILGKE